MKRSVKIVMKDVEISDVLCVRTIKKCCATALVWTVELSGVFIKAGLKAAFSFTYVFFFKFFIYFLLI